MSSHGVGIILGHHYTGFGFTSRQKKRMEKAIALIAAGQISMIMTTGGKGMWKKTTPSMGEVARSYLSKRGIAEAQIFVEDQSTSTLQNAQYALRLMQEREQTSAIVITSADHMPRARSIFLDVFPSTYQLDFAISDYFCGIWSIVDFFWKIAGNFKYAWHQRRTG